MKRKRVKTTSVYCGACQSRCTLDIAKHSSEEEIDQARHETFFICVDCTPEVERLEKEENLYYFCSHIVESVVNFSSHA
jgi:methylphosphotriester-DNA--protein-cysteine methyltransferase